MNSVFQKNLMALKQYYPQLASTILQPDEENYYSILSFPAGEAPNLVCRCNGAATLFYDATSDPLSHVRSVIQKMGVETAPFVILFGAGLGYQLLFLYRMLCDAGPLARILCVEKDIACFRKALETFDFCSVLQDARVKLVVGCPQENLFIACQRAFDTKCYQFMKALRFVPWPAAVALDPGYYKTAKRAVQDIISRWLNRRGNDCYDTLVAYENFLKNLEVYSRHPNVYSLRNLFVKQPAVVVATGPSLNKNIHEIGHIQDRAVILSVDASLRILHQNGIIPHLVTSIERTPGLDKFFRGLSHMEKSVHVVPSFAYPTTISAYKGPRVFMTRPYAFFATLGLRNDMFDMGVSTSLAAFGVAKLMGCDPIILVGNDLSTAEGGVTHAKGCSFGQTQHKFAEKTFPVSGNLGGTVETCQIWYQSIKDYESKIGEFAGTVINATEGGAKIQGTHIMTLKQAIDQYCHSDFNPREKILSKVKQSTNDTSFHGIAVPLENLNNKCHESIVLCQKGLELMRPILMELEKADETIPEPLRQRMYQKIDEIEMIIGNLTGSDFILSIEEFFYPESVPLFLEWQVAKERFADPIWGDAYRLKLAEEFLGIFGMLCTSLNDVLSDGKVRLKKLIEKNINKSKA